MNYARLLGGYPRIETVARESPFESVFRSFEANSCAIKRK